MKINTNMVGNYNPYSINKVKPANVANQVKNVEQVKNISSEEKDFFAKLYPDSKSEIVDYHFYKRNGGMDGVSVGTLFDRRG